jgi:hypothetical protein
MDYLQRWELGGGRLVRPFFWWNDKPRGGGLSKSPGAGSTRLGGHDMGESRRSGITGVAQAGYARAPLA